MPSNRPHIILIDGESGVGKTTLALTMGAALGATVVHLDDVYPGWGGLAAGRDAVIDGVLRPLSEGRAARVRLWDWSNNRPGLDVIVAPSDVVIVEGCGISTRTARELSDVSIWATCDENDRVLRLTDRDRGSFAAYMDMWEAQVAEHIRENDPHTEADVTVRT